MRAARSRWPIAVVEVAAAVALALVLPRFERGHNWPWFVHYESGTAQATLAAIAGGMITLTGFVLTAVTIIVQTVQSQSPRLLRLLNRTDGTPVLFGTFLATSTFALAVLGQVKQDAVPSVSVTISEVLVLVSTCLFLRLLVTFRTSLTTGGLVRTVGRELRRLVDVTYQEDYDPQGDAAHSRPAAAAPTWQLTHKGPPGVFQAFDEPAAVRLAADAGAEIRLVPAVGDFIATGEPLATVTGPPPPAEALAKVVHVGPVRTFEQDPAYGVRVIADIAIRALSPAVNDPTSAVQALDQLDDVLHRLVTRSLGDGRLYDASGVVRVRFPAPRWETFVALAVDEILLYGAGSLQVARRLTALLTDLQAAAPPARREVVTVRLATLRRMVSRAMPDPALAAEATEPDRQGIGSPRRDG
ncbi:MAG TPA: DUF2254 domain-containing protein [Trebonia sp.]